ncbi:hypothetical protein IHE45_04G014300 [Dioscorea alata]|uniref:Uncharacterized protein n=3 Tax=Dioscorea alata TaxID=55571 RepID=A0ACB7WBB1_DIOAL|nr:hypothetical protein IHE45_04G014300 [Dioscorea alata]KAH7685041.1 hypothetical protein IHE45_04G014300 [Dioscorea alata]KAH7685043.1 hypothetical protein IHE45_04G014300 [Dioscorea alata]
MASHIPAAIQNENLPIHRGKGVEGAKTDLSKTVKTKSQGRVALRDLSKASKPAPLGPTKGSTLKEKPKAHDGGTIKNTSKTSFLTDEEIKQCQEWAKEGIEEIPFTGNDQRKQEQEHMEERVRKEVETVLSSLREWMDLAYGFGIPHEEAELDDSMDLLKMQLEPEEHPPFAGYCSYSGNEEIEDVSLEPEFDNYFPYIDHTFKMKLKEEYDSDIVFG